MNRPKESVVVHAVAREPATEYYLTVPVGERATSPESIGALFSETAAVLAGKGIEPLQEKVYGLASSREQVLELRAAALREHGLDPALPVTYIEGKPARGEAFAGIQLWGVAGGDVATVEEGGIAGRHWRGNGFGLLHLSSVDGRSGDGTLPSDPGRQADQMFASASAALGRHGFAYADVRRTWIYVSRILDWYDDLNRARNAHHEKVGLEAVPASTGIQGRSRDEECLMDVLAVQPTGPQEIGIEPISRSPRQDAAPCYGSAFSRGMALEMGGKKTVHLSGTASIDAAGESIHLGDAEAQSVETLLAMAGLLEEQGGGLENICTATLFCKTEQAFLAYRDVTRLLRTPAFPTICVLADVCRPELLVEVEAVAIL